MRRAGRDGRLIEEKRDERRREAKNWMRDGWRDQTGRLRAGGDGQMMDR